MNPIRSGSDLELLVSWLSFTSKVDLSVKQVRCCCGCLSVPRGFVEQTQSSVKETKTECECVCKQLGKRGWHCWNAKKTAERFQGVSATLACWTIGSLSTSDCLSQQHLVSCLFFLLILHTYPYFPFPTSCTNHNRIACSKAKFFSTFALPDWL